MTEHKHLSPTEIADRFEEAIITLRRLHVPGTKPKCYFSSWPEMVYTTWEILAQETKPLRLGAPTPDAISRMEEVLNWIWLIDSTHDRQLIWLRAKRIPWKAICRAMGYGRTKLWQDWMAAMIKLSYRIEEK